MIDNRYVLISIQCYPTLGLLVIRNRLGDLDGEVWGYTIIERSTAKLGVFLLDHLDPGLKNSLQ